MEKRRLNWVDFLKGIAILGVILVHLNGALESPSSIVSALSAIGARCPQMFFIISAYLTWASISKSDDLNTKEFFKKRFVKIAPLYYLALVVITLIPTIHTVSFGDVIAHASFINGFIPTYTNSVMKVEWYIADLAIFYMIVPFLYRYVKNLKTATITFASSVVANVVFTLLTNNVFREEIATSGVYEMYFHTFCFINQLPILLIGILVYYTQKAFGQEMANKKAIFIAVVGVTVVVICAFVGLHLNKSVLTSSLIAGMVFGIITLLCADIKPARMGGGNCCIR